jgi:hypothetical protein
MQIETVEMDMLAPRASTDGADSAKTYLFDREQLRQQLIRLATEQFHASNEPAAYQLCSAAYIASIPRDRTAMKWPTFDDFWSAFKELARACRPGAKAGASA